jgi:hypothetical protein
MLELGAGDDRSILHVLPEDGYFDMDWFYRSDSYKKSFRLMGLSGHGPKY